MRMASKAQGTHRKECAICRRLGGVADLAEAGAAWTRGRGGRALDAAAWAEVFCGRACSGEWVHADPLLGWLDACARPAPLALSRPPALALASRLSPVRAHIEGDGARARARRPARVAGAVARAAPLAYCAAFAGGGAKDVTARRAARPAPRLAVQPL